MPLCSMARAASWSAKVRVSPSGLFLLQRSPGAEWHFQAWRRAFPDSELIGSERSPPRAALGATAQCSEILIRLFGFRLLVWQFTRWNDRSFSGFRRLHFDVLIFGRRWLEHAVTTIELFSQFLILVCRSILFEPWLRQARIACCWVGFTWSLSV